MADASEQVPPRVEPLEPPHALVRGRHGTFVVNVNDLYVGQSLTRYGEYSELEARLLQQLVSPGDVVVEVGANLGALTVPLARAVGPTGRVVAIEPDPANARLLEANLALNALDQVLVHRGACGDAPGHARLDAIDRRAPGNFGAVSLQPSGGAPGPTVPVERLDDLLATDHLRLLKIDVEGMEADVLAGAGDTISRHRPSLYVENDRAERSDALIERIIGLGYDLWWHEPPLYNPDNHFQHHRDVFPGIRSLNMLALPTGRSTRIQGLEPIRAGEPHPSLRE